jgi:hypothetical protein
MIPLFLETPICGKANAINLVSQVMHALNEATKQRRNMDTARLDMAKLCEAKAGSTS